MIGGAIVHESYEGGMELRLLLMQKGRVAERRQCRDPKALALTAEHA